jgi:hypothetical protein
LKSSTRFSVAANGEVNLSSLLTSTRPNNFSPNPKCPALEHQLGINGTLALHCLVALKASFAASGTVKPTAHIAPTFHTATLLAIRVSRTGPNLSFCLRLSHLVIKKPRR